MNKVLFILLFCALTISLSAQRKSKKPTEANPVTTPSGPAGLSGMTGAKKEGPKPYKEVITDKALTQHGLFTVHKVEDKYYFEIADSLMNKEIMAITRF